MRPVSVVRRPLFGRASLDAIQGEEEAVAAGLQRQSRLLNPLRTLVLQRSQSGNTLQISASAARETPSPSSLSSSSTADSPAACDEALPHPHPLPDMPVKLGAGQRWTERAFLFSYICDFLVGPVYDRVLLPRPGTKIDSGWMHVYMSVVFLPPPHKGEEIQPHGRPLTCTHITIDYSGRQAPRPPRPGLVRAHAELPADGGPAGAGGFPRLPCALREPARVHRPQGGRDLSVLGQAWVGGRCVRIRVCRVCLFLVII